MLNRSGCVTLDRLSPSTKLVIKLFIEFMPLGLFFLVTTEYDFRTGTAVLMAATVVSLAATWYLFRQLALMAIITAVTSIAAGGLTLALGDNDYVKMKPTIVGSIFSVILAVALLTRLPLFKALLGQNIALTDEGWRVLTWLWLAYFIFISGLNEYIWRTQSEHFWVTFKAFALMPMTVIYALPQIYLLKRYRTTVAKAVKHHGQKPDKRPVSVTPANITAKSTTS
jgi:intracellular septation protein